jgi:hypothetical protein
MAASLRLINALRSSGSVFPSILRRRFLHLTMTTLDELFPIPGPPTSDLLPSRWPGVSAASGAALVETLKTNHEKWHLFFNDKKYHKSVV